MKPVFSSLFIIHASRNLPHGQVAVASTALFVISKLDLTYMDLLYLIKLGTEACPCLYFFNEAYILEINP